MSCNVGQWRGGSMLEILRNAKSKSLTHKTVFKVGKTSGREYCITVPLTEQERAEREKIFAAQFVEPFRFLLCGGISDPFCENCRALADALCDYPIGDGKTCDAILCTDCATKVHPEGALEPLDLCPFHAHISRVEHDTKLQVSR